MIKNHLTPKMLEKLHYIATIESIGASTRLAGSTMSNKESRRIIISTKNTVPSK